MSNKQLRKKLQRKYKLTAEDANELMGMLQDARGEGIQIGQGLFSKALNLIKKVNNTVHDIPIYAAKPVSAVLKTVGKIGGPVKTLTNLADKGVKKVAQIASLAPAENPDWQYKWRTKHSSENHALMTDGVPPVSRLYRAKYAGQFWARNN